MSSRIGDPVVDDLTGRVPPGDAFDLGERLALRDLEDREIIFVARKRNRPRSMASRLFCGFDRHLRTDQTDQRLGIARADQLRRVDVLAEGRRRGVEDDQFLVVHLMLDIVPALVVRGRIDQARALGTIAAGCASQVGYQNDFTSRFIW
jgi:hypothetical protein